MAGELYWKVPFVLSGTHQPSDDDVAPEVGWRRLNHDVDLGLVGQCLSASVDGWDVSAIRQIGPARTAALVLADSTGYSHQPDWWEVVTVDGLPAGFILPVLFDHADLDGVPEATIFHVGVLPQFRGRGLARHLLRRATRTLLRHGVWRIYCDTAANNDPMRYLFTAEGWTRLQAHQRPTYGGGATEGSPDA